ncbi:MAG: sigma factor [Acidimicrobiales bacterium]
MSAILAPASGKVSLAGTLFVPFGAGPHPAVVLAHGSGPRDRQSLLLMADLFARNGIAALAYDKRGSGGSTGSYREIGADFRSLAEDVVAGVGHLRGRGDIDAGRVGVWGVSEGGYVVALAAASPEVAFVVGVSAPGVSARRSAPSSPRNDGRLRAVAFRLLRDPERVEDVLQNAYLKAFRSIGRFRCDAEVGTWLYRITYNTCLSEGRRAGPPPHYDVDVAAEGNAGRRVEGRDQGRLAETPSARSRWRCRWARPCRPDRSRHGSRGCGRAREVRRLSLRRPPMPARANPGPPVWRPALPCLRSVPPQAFHGDHSLCAFLCSLSARPAVAGRVRLLEL